jgi:flagellar P-ring protein precursor FlgI
MRRHNSNIRALLLSLLLAAASVCAPAHGERIKDIAGVAGVRSNQLVGYGLVVGLDGSGDQVIQAPFTVQSLRNFLTQMGLNLPTGVNPQLTNIAAVSVHAELPPFAKPGQTLDVTVSSVGNAKSLRGGSLLMTELRGPDGEVYALAQGSLLVSGFGAEGADGSSVTVNIPSAGRIPNGAIVERGVPSPFATAPLMVMNLHSPDFTTAQRVSARINEAFGEGTAQPVDAISVEVQAPQDPASKVAFLSLLENLEIDPAAAPAKVVVNSRNGTIVIGAEVRVETRRRCPRQSHGDDRRGYQRQPAGRLRRSGPDGDHTRLGGQPRGGECTHVPPRAGHLAPGAGGGGQCRRCRAR